MRHGPSSLTGEQGGCIGPVLPVQSTLRNDEVREIMLLQIPPAGLLHGAEAQDPNGSCPRHPGG